MPVDLAVKVMPWCPLSPCMRYRCPLSLRSCPLALAAAEQQVMRGRVEWLGGTQMVLGAARLLTACRCPLAAAEQQVLRGRVEWLGGALPVEDSDFGIVVADR